MEEGKPGDEEPEYSATLRERFGLSPRPVAARGEAVVRHESTRAEEEPLDPEAVQIRILAEVEAIRYRLSVLVVFLVIVPLVVGFTVGLAIGFD